MTGITWGSYNGCVFPTGNVIVDDTLFVYYGAADKHIGVATANLKAFLDYVVDQCSL